MRKKTKNAASWSIGLIFLVLLVTVLFVANGNSSGSDPISYSASALVSLEEHFDFNTISMKDGDVSHIFEIKNDGTEPINIKKVYTSCMCTTALVTNGSGKQYGKFGMPGHSLPSRTNIEIEPGGSATVEAIFDPKAHGPSGIGLAQRSVYLETDSTKSPKLELSFQATVTR